MKFRCERDSLVEALTTAGRAVSSRATSSAALNGVRIESEGNRLLVAERIAPGPIRRLRSQIRQTWLSLAGRRQAETERQGEKV